MRLERVTVADLVEWIKYLINEPIQVPVLTTLYREMTGQQLTVLNVVSLVCAAPLILYNTGQTEGFGPDTSKLLGKFLLILNTFRSIFAMPGTSADPNAWAAWGTGVLGTAEGLILFCIGQGGFSLANLPQLGSPLAAINPVAAICFFSYLWAYDTPQEDHQGPLRHRRHHRGRRGRPRGPGGGRLHLDRARREPGHVTQAWRPES